jgi:hypothetical protein
MVDGIIMLEAHEGKRSHRKISARVREGSSNNPSKPYLLNVPHFTTAYTGSKFPTDEPLGKTFEPYPNHSKPMWPYAKR